MQITLKLYYIMNICQQPIGKLIIGYKQFSDHLHIHYIEVSLYTYFLGLTIYCICLAMYDISIPNLLYARSVFWILDIV